MRQELVNNAINVPLVTSEKSAKLFLDRFKSKDEKEWAPSIELLNDRFKLLDYALEGRDIPEKYQEILVKKSASTGVRPAIAYVDGIENDFDRLRLDVGYMDNYRFVPADNATEVHITDFEGLIRHAEIQMGDTPANQPFGQETKDRMGLKQWGGASFAFNIFMRGQTRYTLNGLVRGHQLAELRLRSDQAYTQIGTQTPGGTTAFATNIITTINNAYVTLVQRMQTTGWQMSDTEPAIIWFHGTHKAAVNAAFRTIMGENGTNIMLEFPVVPKFTWNANFPTTFGGVAAGLMVFPGKKNIYANFQNARLEQEPDKSVDAMRLYYRYYFNSQVEGDQSQIVNIA